jgi:hypothetical protein
LLFDRAKFGAQPPSDKDLSLEWLGAKGSRKPALSEAERGTCFSIA